MKRLLILSLLLIPTLASGEGQIAEEWTTYCDNGIEKVRVSIVFEFRGEYTVYSGEIVPHSGDACDVEVCGYSHDAIFEDLGGSEDGHHQYKITWEGFARECFVGSSVSRRGQVVFRFTDEFGEYDYYLWDLFCDDFEPQTLLDTVDCVPLPVASSTWGAIKALYR